MVEVVVEGPTGPEEGDESPVVVLVLTLPEETQSSGGEPKTLSLYVQDITTQTVRTPPSCNDRET